MSIRGGVLIWMGCLKNNAFCAGRHIASQQRSIAASLTSKSTYEPGEQIPEKQYRQGCQPEQENKQTQTKCDQGDRGHDRHEDQLQLNRLLASQLHTREFK